MSILFIGGFFMIFFCSPVLAGDIFETDSNVMAVVTGVPGDSAGVDVNIPQAGYHYEAAIPVGQPFLAGTILKVIEVEGNYLELEFRDGSTLRMESGDSYTVPSFEYTYESTIDTQKVPGTGNTYEVIKTDVEHTVTPTPLPDPVKGNIEDIGEAIDAYDAGEISSDDVFSIINDAIGSVMSFIDSLFSGSSS
jgi:hypothetical protein